MHRNVRGTPARIGEYDYGNGRRGRHPIRRNRFAAGPPPWVRQPVVEPVEATASEIATNDALYGERDRSIDQQMADMEVWE
jgi:hypothetical protein